MRQIFDLAVVETLDVSAGRQRPTESCQHIKCAGVAELADALASGASDRKVVWVQVPSPAP